MIPSTLEGPLPCRRTKFTAMLIRSFLHKRRVPFLTILVLGTAAGALEAGFVLILKFITGQAAGTGGIPESYYLQAGFGVLVILVVLRTLASAAQYRRMVGMIRNWTDARRAAFCLALENTTWPLYREDNLPRIHQCFSRNIATVRQGLMSWFNSLSSLIQFFLFLPLLFLFPWRLSASVLVLLVPVWLVSRFRISILTGLSRENVSAGHRIENAVRDFSGTMEYNLANAAIGRASEALLKTVSGEEDHQDRWEYRQAVFPQYMETVFFLMITLAVIFALSRSSVLPGGLWDYFPFFILLLLMYKPVREWARHFPRFVMGRQAWDEFDLLMSQLNARAPRPPVRTSGDGRLVMEDIRFRYGLLSVSTGAAGTEDVFSGFSLSLAPDQMTLLGGPNGSGKSTLLKIIAGLEFPQAGSILYPQAWMRNARPALGYLPQKFTSSAAGLRQLFRLRQERPEEWAALDEVLGLSPVLNKLKAEPEQCPLSGTAVSAGENQRLGLARVFSGDAHYLLLDEPVTWLPGAMRLPVLEGLMGLWKKKHPSGGMLIVSHEAGFESLFGRTVTLDG